MRCFLKVAGLMVLAVSGYAALAPITAVPAEAAACVRGARGAACAGPRGAVATTRRPVVVAPVRRGPVVVAPVRRGAVIVR
jgi:hypothetical protein